MNTINITSRTGLLNYLSEAYKLDSYIEIGVQRREQNFDKIKCKRKVGVDPEILPYYDNPIYLVNVESDNFFNIRHKYFDKVELAFIDGWHEASQVQRDFENCLSCLDDKGYIVIHDVLPTEEQYTTVPRASKRWYGNVYLFCMTMKSKYDGIDFVTLDMDCGCMVVWKDKSKKALKGSIKPNWDNYIKHGKSSLNVIEPEEFFRRNIS